LDSDESASIVNAATRTRMSDARITAGTTTGNARRNSRLPDRMTCIATSSSAGSIVAHRRNTTRISSFPPTYSDRSRGFDRYSCSALARRSLAMSPAPT
jgi:hypothetical protein